MTRSHAKRPSAHPLNTARRHLAAWLHEWAIDRALTPDPNTPDTQHPGPPRKADRLPEVTPASRCTEPCVPGDIRLIHPSGNTPVCLPPLYVAVLDAATPEDWRIVPFGRFSIPAIPSEWRTGLSAMPLRVLCFWGTRRVPGTTLAHRSWHAGKLPKGLLIRAQAACAETPGRTTSASKSAGPVTGPPLAHPLDPRWTYLAQESDRIEATFSAAGITPSSARQQQVDYYPLAGDSMLRAAEDRADSGGKPGAR